MITEQDLQEAIAECQGVRNPNASTCIKLAAFLTIQRELYGEKQADGKSMPQAGYSYDYEPAQEDGMIFYSSETEFSEVINGMYQDDVIAVMDELMTTLQVVQPRIYASVIRKLKEN